MSATTEVSGRLEGASRLVARGHGVLSYLVRETPFAQLVVLVALFALGAATLDGFTQLSSVKSMLLLASFLGIAALGQTLVVLIGHIDLSIPGFIALGNVLIVLLVGEHGWAFAPAAGTIVACSLVVGALSGYICHRFGVQSIVVTLGMNFVLLGGVGLLSEGGIQGEVPAWLTRFASVRGTTFDIGIPPLIVLWAAIAIITGVVLRRTVAGRRLYLTGSNPAAAPLALVKTGRVVTAAFAVSGLAAAIAGVLLSGFSGSDDASIGTPYLFTSLTAVVIGGTSITGARGDYWRTVLGSMILIVLTTLLVGHGYDNADQEILFGLAILVVVFAYGRKRRVRDRV